MRFVRSKLAEYEDSPPGPTTQIRKPLTQAQKEAIRKRIKNDARTVMIKTVVASFLVFVLLAIVTLWLYKRYW